MPRELEKPFIEWASYYYGNITMSENFFVVESDIQIKGYLKSKSPEEFKDWLKGVRTASNNNAPINSMLTYEYFTEGMDKPYKNDITYLLITALPGENAQYAENLYHLLTNYEPGSNWAWCKKTNDLKNSSLSREWKEKFLGLCSTFKGGKGRTRKSSKGRKNSKNSKKQRKTYRK